MSYENRDIDLSVNLPVTECDSCGQKFVLIKVNDCAEFDVDHVIYFQSRAKHCPYCGNDTDSTKE